MGSHASADRRTAGWRPASEAEAASNMAAFVEWLRATGVRPDACPEDVRRWRRAGPDAALAAIAAFVRADQADRDLLEALAGHLLEAETRPGDTIVWSGDPDAAWPRAARLLGAEVVAVRPDAPGSDAPGTPPRSLP